MKENDIIDYFKNITIPDFEFRLVEKKYLGYENLNSSKVCSIGVLNLSNQESRGLSCYLQFPLYEKLSRESQNINDSAFSPPSVRPFTQRKIITYEFGKNVQDKFPIKISSKTDLDNIRGLLKTYFHQDARPFFNYWQDIRVFLPFIQEDTSQSASLLGNSYILKKMVIWKLCSHPEYENFVYAKIEALEKVIIKTLDNENYLHILNEIRLKYKLLKDVEPEFEWNRNYLIKQPYKKV